MSGIQERGTDMKRLLFWMLLLMTTPLFGAFYPNIMSTNPPSYFTNKTLPYWLNVKDPPYNALGNSNANDTASIQLALNSVPSSNGGVVYLPKGTYLHDGLTVTNYRVQILGDGYGTILKRRTGGTTDALLVTGQQFQLRNIRLEAGLTLATNVNSSLCLSNISDSTVENVWFFGDWDQAKVFYGNNHRFQNNIFEASQHNQLWFYQSFLDIVQGNAFYNAGNGVDDGTTNTTASVLIQNDPVYSFHPYGTLIANNIFRKELYAHGVHLTNANNIVISGNLFNLCGTFDPSTKDDICIRGSTNILVMNNTATGTNNDYNPGNRASRWAVNTDANSDYVEVWPATMLESGIVGKINNNVVHMEYSDMGLGTLLQGALTVPKILTTGGAAGNITDPALRVLNNRSITFLDHNAGYTMAGGIWMDNTDTMNFFAGNSTLKGWKIDTNGNVTLNTATPLGKLTVNGTTVLGAAGIISLYDSGGVGIWQQNNHDWEWFNNGLGNIAMILTKDGQIVLGNTNSLQIRDTGGNNEKTVTVDGANNLVLSSPTIGGGIIDNVRKGDQTMRWQFASNTVVTLASNALAVTVPTTFSQGIIVTGGITNTGDGVHLGGYRLFETNGVNSVFIVGQEQLNATITNGWPGTNAVGFMANDGAGKLKWTQSLSISNGVAPISFTFPATTVNWTNTFPFSIEVYIDNLGVTGTAIKKNGGQILGGLISGYTLILQPNEYFSETYSISTPTAKWSPIP